LRLFLLAAQISDECGFEDLTYDLYVEAFTVYEESISESARATASDYAHHRHATGLEGVRVDNYDTLITKAALHGAKLLKKPHQASAVHLASHLWWQEREAPVPEEGVSPTSPGAPTKDATKDAEKSPAPKEDAPENAKAVSRTSAEWTHVSADCMFCMQYPLQDSKRVLECLQKSLRIANSATEEIVTIQLYVDTLDQYLFYLDGGAPAVSRPPAPPSR